MFHGKNFWKQNESFYFSEHSKEMTQVYKHIQCNGNNDKSCPRHGSQTKKGILSISGGRGQGEQRKVDPVHYRGADRLLILGLGTGLRCCINL